MRLAQATWAPGTQFSRYELLGRLARGGMAEVWRAAVNGVQGFRRQVVIKAMRPELAVSADLVRMFINEATIAARLSHPGIVHVFDFGQLEERYFIAMEYVPGLSVRQLGRALRERRLRLPRRAVLNLGVAVARALAYAHGACENGLPLGFVHRDISPENIMVSSQGATKLIDFGAAMTRSCPPPNRAFVGKFRYLSPERLRGEAGDPRADIYALGIVLYECLTGRRPYDSDNVERLIDAGGATDPCRVVPGLPPRLAAVVMRAMAVDPQQRYARAGELADDLSELLEGPLGRDPQGATDEQALEILRRSEREALAQSNARTAIGDHAATAAAEPSAATGGRAAGEGQVGAGVDVPPVRTGHLRGTSVAVVVNDVADSDEVTDLEAGAPWAGVDTDIDTHLNDPSPDDRQAVEMNPSPGAPPARAVPTPTAGSDRPPRRDPLEVVQRSLPELHSATAWLGPAQRQAILSPPQPASSERRSQAAEPATYLTPTPTPTPTSTPVALRSVSAAACFERGLRLIAAKDLDAALVQWRRASALDPERTWYRTNLERLVRHIQSDRRG